MRVSYVLDYHAIAVIAFGTFIGMLHGLLG